MAIIISKDGKDAQRVETSNFVAENNLQEYIYKNPNVIPLYDIDSDIRLFIVAREFQTKSGPIDALGFDQNGNIYVIETKLYGNQDKRKVVAQLLDYGASLWRNTTDLDEFIGALNTHTRKQFGESFEVLLSEFFALEDVSDMVLAIKDNLNAGNIKFVVLMDKLHNQLKDLIVFINQNSQFDIYAVEVEYYKHAEFEIMIPKLFGNEVKKEIATSNTGQWIRISRDEWLNSMQGEFADNMRRISEIYDTIGKYLKLPDIAFGDYFHMPPTERRVERCSRFFGTERGADIEICNNGQMNFFGFTKKDTPHMNFAKKVIEQIVEQGLFGKTSTDLEKRDFLILHHQVNKSDLDKLVVIHEEVARAMGWL